MTSSDQSVRDMYAGNAASYDKLMDSEIDLPMYGETFKRLADAIADVQGPLVDSSCGSGHMLERYRSAYDAKRPLIGIDLSPEMVAIAHRRLGEHAVVEVGDMRLLASVPEESAAAVISFFAIHHVNSEDAAAAFACWRNRLRKGGVLVVAAWEGNGAIDYGEAADIVAMRYSADELRAWAERAELVVDDVTVSPIEGMGMDAVYLYAHRAS